MDLMQALEQGLVEGYPKPDRVITTVISKLFICGEKVLKVYKHQPFFFADLAQFESRKAFFAEDFFWNNTAAPEIYTHLWGVEQKGAGYALVPPGLGEDFIIEMARIDDSQTLTKLLTAGSLTKEQVPPFIDALVDTLATLTRERKEQLTHLFDKGLYEIMKEDVASMRAWLYSSPNNISKEDADRCADTMLKGVEADPYFKEAGRAALSAAIDNNSDNLLLREGRASFIDIMPPMIIWRVVDEYSTMSRVITDIEILGGQELGDAARAAYAKYQRSVPPIARLVHEIRAAAIQWSYRYELKQPEIADKFGAAVKQKVAELEALLK